MIEAVFFDLYNTLVYFHPPREERQALACQEFGLVVDPATLRRAHVAAEDFLTLANAKISLNQLSLEGRAAVYTEYEQAWLAAAGVEVDLELARSIYAAYQRQPYTLQVFEDVWPTLAELKARGLAMGIVSNSTSDVSPICAGLGLDRPFDFILCSCTVGVEKPDPRIFAQALAKAGVAPQRAIHVGDQYHSDVVGARAAGIRPLLLDRHGLLAGVDGVERVSSLAEVLAVAEPGAKSS